MPEPTALSPVEHLFTGAGAYPITMTFSYERPMELDTLRSGLVVALQSFPWVSSRLCAVDDHTWGLALESELTALDSADELVSVDTRDGEPVAGFALSTDGRCLRASISHAVVDGFSFFQFLTSWARLTRGDRILSPTRDGLPVTAEDGPLTAADVHARCGVVWDETRVPSPALREARLFIANEELSALRERAKDVRLFDNDLIAARLWKEHGRHDNGDSLLSVPIDLRPLLRARRHFGCAVGFATARVAADELETISVIELACRVRSAVARVDAAAAGVMLGTLERLRREQGRAVMEQLHVRHPRAGLIVTNLTRMPVHDLDFGQGPPRHVSARSQIDYTAALFARDEGVEAHVYLPE